EDPAAEIAGCVAECVAQRPTPAQIACALAAPDCEAIEACGDEPVDPQAQAQCEVLCDTVPACIGEDPGPDCVAECVAEAPAEIRACLIDAGEDCEAVFACLEFTGEASCEAACAHIDECSPEPPDPEAFADCVVTCQADFTPAVAACVAAADCEGIEACVADPPQPGLEAQCRGYCETFVDCEGEVPAEQRPLFLAECTQGCVAESTAAERMCLDQAGRDCAAAQACFGGGMPPDPVPDPAEVGAACAAACDILMGCQGVPPEQAQAALAQCNAGCVAESTVEERACVLGAPGCEAVFACFNEG
ncbi:MAG: hypothetical protein KC613_11535, partial [Myxococcales bacterium]|nr:hypothetical protein [Myxococcales bacterium]